MRFCTVEALSFPWRAGTSVTPRLTMRPPGCIGRGLLASAHPPGNEAPWQVLVQTALLLPQRARLPVGLLLSYSSLTVQRSLKHVRSQC